MEDSYTVHRRRKAAARNREKTPDPPRRDVDSAEDEDARIKMERMVADTEQMEEETAKQRSDNVFLGVPDVRTTRRQISDVEKPTVSDKIRGDVVNAVDKDVSVPRKSSTNVDGPAKNSSPPENNTPPRDSDATDAKVELKTVPRALNSSLTSANDEGASEGASKPGEVVDDAARTSSKVTESGETAKVADADQERKTGQGGERRVKKRSKDRAGERKKNYTTDSSDNEEGIKQSLRGKKSPEGAGIKSGSGKGSAGRSRPPTDTDDDPNASRNESFTEKSKANREKRYSSKQRPSIGTDDDDSSPRKSESLTEKSKNDHEKHGTVRSRPTTDTDEDAQPKKRDEKTRLREKRSASRHGHPGDAEDDARMKKSESFPQRSVEKQTIKRSTSDMKKQIILLSDDSLIQDFAKAQQEYLRRGTGILDPDPMDAFYSNTGGTSVRRRKVSIVHSNPEKEEIVKKLAPKKSWFSWLPFLHKKEKADASSPDVKPEDEKPRGTPVEQQIATEKVSLLEFLRTFREIVSEFKAFVEQNPRETEILRKLRNSCIAGLLLIVIYCGLGAFVFRFTEGAFETFYKCGVKRVKRDFLDTLWNYSHNMREDDWKSMARRKLMEFEEQLHTAHEAGVHSYSGQRSWTFLNALVYCLTVVTTIGYGHIAPSTTTGRAITIVYAIFGIPMFLIILADFGKLFTRGIKFLWAFVRRLYYTGSCRKVRGTARMQEVMKGVQLVYDFATFRRPSQMNPEEIEEIQKQQNLQAQTVLNLDGNMPPQPDTPGTPAMSNFAIDDEFNLPISVAIFILLVYIFVGATIYYLWEKWTFFESFYFVFISMSTIGFGDYVPQHPIYMMCSIVYLVFGLALTSMCINVVQVMLSDSFKQASQKIGATIGFEVVDEDGSIQPTVPLAVELADVHTAVNETESDDKEKVAPKARQEDVDL